MLRLLQTLNEAVDYYATNCNGKHALCVFGKDCYEVSNLKQAKEFFAKYLKPKKPVTNAKNKVCN